METGTTFISFKPNYSLKISDLETSDIIQQTKILISLQGCAADMYFCSLHMQKSGCLMTFSHFSTKTNV